MYLCSYRILFIGKLKFIKVSDEVLLLLFLSFSILQFLYISQSEIFQRIFHFQNNRQFFCFLILFKTNSKHSVHTREVQPPNTLLSSVELKIAMTSAFFETEELPTSRTDEGTYMLKIFPLGKSLNCICFKTEYLAQEQSAFLANDYLGFSICMKAWWQPHTTENHHVESLTVLFRREFHFSF